MIPAMKDPALWLPGYCACLPGRRRASSVTGQAELAVTGRAETGGDQQRPELVTVEPSGMRLIVQARPPDMSRRRVIEELLLGGVPVKPGDSAQTAGDGGPGRGRGLPSPGRSTRYPHGAHGTGECDAAGTS